MGLIGFGAGTPTIRKAWPIQRPYLSTQKINNLLEGVWEAQAAQAHRPQRGSTFV
jgi:hypothetical protein